MGAEVCSSDNRNWVLHTGIVVGAGGLLVGVMLGLGAEWRSAGLGVAPALASDSQHLRALVMLLYGCTALVSSILWSRLSSDAPAVARLRGHMRLLVIFCGIGPLLTVLLNYTIFTGITPDHLGLLEPLLALAVAALYAMVVHRLSGITGVGMGARLMLRSSYIWLTVTAALHLVWTATRVFGDNPRILWFVERPTIEVAMIGFGIPAALGVLLVSLHAIYHSRNMTQTLMGTYQLTNGLVVLWGASLMWVVRFPGGYQGLASAVVGIALMILLASIAGSSGFLERRSLPWVNGSTPVDGPWAVAMASMTMLLIVVTGVLIGVSGIVLAGLGQQPPVGTFAAELMAVALGLVPLASAAAVATGMPGKPTRLAVGASMVAVGAVGATMLWSLSGVVERSVGIPTGLAELLIAGGLVLIAAGAQKVSMPER